jgi:H+/Cl- antiporter ClcA
VRDARRKIKTLQTPEEARQKAKSWQLALSAIVLSGIGFLLSVIVVRSASGLVEDWLHNGRKALPDLRSVFYLALLYVYAGIAFVFLDLAKAFTKELRRRWIRL